MESAGNSVGKGVWFLVGAGGAGVNALIRPVVSLITNNVDKSG